MKRKIKKMLDTVYKNNGGTFLINKNRVKKIKKGFVGGIKESEEVFSLYNFYEKNVKNFLKKYKNIDRIIVGFWIYENKMYMNLCVVNNKEAKIKEFCKENNLIAYYDLNNKKNIFLK